MLLTLPEPIIDILEYLSIHDRRVALATSRLLWNKRHALEKKIHFLAVHEIRDFCILSDPEFLKPLIHLQRLDLQHFCTDEFLHVLAKHELLPNLKELLIVGSMGVSNKGLESIAQALPSLNYLDITFCRNTTYAGTFCLRKRGSEIIIRRQPTWMDGRFQTNFDNDGLHTYWCDGSFQFERDTQSCGFVCDLEGIDGDRFHVSKKLQYNNFTPPVTWGNWTRFFNRPGVSLLNLPNRFDGTHQILVGQSMFGLKPPTEILLLQQALSVNDGSTYFGPNDEPLLDDQDIRYRYTMVSRMTVLPLDKLMPPDDVVTTNISFCEEMMRSPDYWQGDEYENLLHDALNGIE